MNPEHTAKTLQALNLLSREVEDAQKRLRNAFDELTAPAGVTYYRCREAGYADPPLPKWLIVMSAGHRIAVRHKDGEYISCGLDGPGPEFDGVDIVRAKVIGMDHKPVRHSWEPHYNEYFLLVEEIPEKP